MTAIILFDIDGTILLTGGAGKSAIEKAFEELFGCRDVWKSYVPDGKTDPFIFDELFQEAVGRKITQTEHQNLMDRYLYWFYREIDQSENFRLMPGIEALIRDLNRQQDILLGIATGNIEKIAWKKLEKANLHSYFRFGGFGSDSADRPELTRIGIERGVRLVDGEYQLFVVGDTVHDVQAGKKCGAATIAVATGKTKRPELERAKPDYLFDNLKSISEFRSAITGSRKVHSRISPGNSL